MDNYKFGKYLSKPSSSEEVIITGVSGRYPGSKNIQELSDHLFAKRSPLTDSKKRYNIEHPNLPKQGGYVQDLEKFDAGHFGLHYRQVNAMDATLRKFLEVAVEALMDAGLHPSELEGTKTGVFVGTSWTDVEIRTMKAIDKPQSFGITGYSKCFIPHRVSYYLKLKGPSYTVDTACSSSLNALEMAFKAIRSGQCDSALVGGAHLCLQPDMTFQFYKLGVLSYKGVCKVFDQDADGYVRSESVICMLLQRANCARRNYGQVIYAKTNDDGFKTEGITFPSTQMQAKLIKDTLKDTGISPSDISYLEAHGTGTKVGDHEEVQAIDKAIAQHRKTPLWIGSVKSNIGHAEPASGLCSLSKILITIETGFIPPNVNLKTIKSSLLPVLEGRIKIVTEQKKLESEEAIVAINNFGFGGNNSHVLIRRFKKTKVEKGIPEDEIPRLVCVSGRTEEAVLTLLNDINRKSLDAEYVALLHHVFKRNIVSHPFRGYTILSKSGPLKSSLKRYNYSHLYVHLGSLEETYKNLGKYLLTFPAFKKITLKLDAHLTALNTNFVELLLKKKSDTKSDLLGTFLVQIGIMDLFKLLNIHPKAVYGDNVSAFVTKYYYEAITLKEAVFTAYEYITSSIEQFKSDTFISKIKHYNNFNLIDRFDLNDISKNAMILNISDHRMFEKDVLMVEDGVVKFLEILGCLYEQSYNPQLHELYPDIQYPVSRATPMISPSIRWNYEKKWYISNIQPLKEEVLQETEFELGTFLDDHKFMKGHVIDGRNLVPGTAYIYMAWEAFVRRHQLNLADTPVVLENCKFIRAVNLPERSIIKLNVAINIKTGHFNIFQKEILVVSGRIFTPKDISKHVTNLPLPILDESDPALILSQDEIYRELYLRGYNYSGLFKGIIKCNTMPSVGLVQWENNWTAFIDKMLQLKILQLDTRSLYVPVAIDKIIINPIEHLKQANNENSTVYPVYIYKENEVIKSGGIEIRGLHASSISKRKLRLNPVLEKHVFVPNEYTTDLINSIRINIQIVLENILEDNFKAVEIVDNSDHIESNLLLPIVSQVVEDMPSIKPELTILTKKDIAEIPGIKIENFALTQSSNLSLIVGHKIFATSDFKNILSALSEDGFVLTEEGRDYIPNKDQNIDIVTQHTTENGMLILFRKAKSTQKIKYLEVSSCDFKWLPNLQQTLKEESEVFIFSQDRELDGIMGFINCIRREPRGNRLKCIFITENAPTFDPLLPFYQNQIKKKLALNIYKDSKWGTYRHLLLEEPKNVKGEHFYVNTRTRGDLSTLKWIKGALTLNTPLKKEQVLIKNYYASLNFKDIMIASGRLNVETSGPYRLIQENCLGFEFSGTNIEGKRLAGVMMYSGLSTLLIADENFLWSVPDSWTLEEAATISSVYFTVIYSLLKVAVVKPGTSILIHSATGGIGLAALNVCLYYKCKVFVTVGTQEKRNYLNQHFPQIPNSHIGNSRDTSFEEMIKKETKGRGVDIVLNSLTEEKLLASVRCLTRGGTFVEIGKYDLANNTALNLLLLENEITYHGVMLDQINAPEEKRWMVEKIEEGIRLGFVKPLTKTVFKHDEIEKAFRYMTSGKHIGKVLIKIRDEKSISISIFQGFPRFNCQSEKSYVIIGGLGGLGLELTDWLVLRGARKVLLVTSSGVKTGYQSQRLSWWMSYGVMIKVSQTDITTKEGCRELIKEANSLGPVDGIFNLAVVLKDALFEDQSEENFKISFAPKAHATVYLDQITREFCSTLRYFVVFSSVSCGRGNAGQTNYGMANSVMERVCERRKMDGLPALAIQWGAVGEVGLVAKMQKENRELVIGGTLQQKVSSCMEVLDKFLNQDNPVVSSMVVAEKITKKYDSESAAEAVATILGIKDLKTISQHATFPELGMDSMMGTEVVQVLEKNFEIYVTPKDVRNLTFAELNKIENEKKGTAMGKSANNNVQPTISLLQYIPENKTSKSNIFNISNLVDNEIEASTVIVFSGIEGVFKPLENLTKNLKARVFGVYYNYDKPEDSVEEYAKAILPHLKNHIIKNKTFHIVGYSFGVLVGLEVVHLLEKYGYIGSVIAIDGSPTYTVAAVKQFLPEETEAELQTSLISKIMKVVLLSDVATKNKKKFLKCNNFDERIDLLLSLIPSRDSIEYVEKQAAVTIYKRFKAVLNYKFVHEKVKSSVILIKARYPLISNIESDYNLSEVSEQPVQVHTVEGDHNTMLKQPQLIKIINQLLH